MSEARAIQDILRRLRSLEALSQIEYDTGTYTPTYLGGTTAGATTYSVQLGAYTQIGNIVLVTGNVAWTAATGTGNAQISLPFTPISRGAGALWMQNVTFANGTPLLQIAAQPFFLMYSPATNAAGAIVQVEGAGDVRFMCVLFV